MPYVREKLDGIVGGWYGSSPEPLIKLAREHGWWDLWAAVVRSATVPKYFNEETCRVLDDAALDDSTRVERLRRCAESRGSGTGRVSAWRASICSRTISRPGCTGRYPQLVRGPFKPNVVPRWWQGGPRLLAAAQEAGDEELVDVLASRYVTRRRL